VSPAVSWVPRDKNWKPVRKSLWRWWRYRLQFGGPLHQRRQRSGSTGCRDPYSCRPTVGSSECSLRLAPRARRDESAQPGILHEFLVVHQPPFTAVRGERPRRQSWDESDNFVTTISGCRGGRDAESEGRIRTVRRSNGDMKPALSVRGRPGSPHPPTVRGVESGPSRRRRPVRDRGTPRLQSGEEVRAPTSPREARGNSLTLGGSVAPSPGPRQ
jgi:hypothetical protein